MKNLPAVIFCVLFFGGFGIFSAAWAVVSVTRGELLNAVVTLGVATFCLGFVISLVTLIPGNVAPRVKVEADGTTFRSDGAVDLPLHIAFSGAAVAAVVYTIFAPAGKVTIPIPPAMRYSLPFMSGALLMYVVPLLWRNLRRGGMSCLRLTRSGFEFEEGWHRASGDWDQVTDVTDSIPDKNVSGSGPIVFVMSDNSTPTISASGMTSNGKALRDLVRFYLKHPESRDELTDGTAVERLARSLAQE
jgi:hypothetical protein